MVSTPSPPLSLCVVSGERELCGKAGLNKNMKGECNLGVSYSWNCIRAGGIESQYLLTVCCRQTLTLYLVFTVTP